MPGPSSPFLDPTSGGQGGYGSGYYSPDAHNQPTFDPNARNGWQWQPGADVGQGEQRGAAVGNFSQQLMQRQGPQFEGQSQAGLDAARSEQRGALGLMQSYAQGNGPSVSQAQTYQGLGSNIGAMNAASQARGQAAPAMGAGYSAGTQVANQGGMARSQEQAGLTNAYGQAANNLRNSDITQYGTDQQQLARARQLATQQGTLNAQTTYGVQSMEEQNEMNNESYQQALAQQGQQAANQSWQQDVNGFETGVNTIASMGGKSDARSKTNVRRGIMSY